MSSFRENFFLYTQRYNKKPFASNKGKLEKLEKLIITISSIKNCELKKNANNLVFADGNPDASVMIIGEGPGANEDKAGLPFVGRAGQLLDKMLNSINPFKSKISTKSNSIQRILRG